MRERNIIFVSNVLANGGAARVLCLLANQFANEGQNVGVLSFKPHEKEYTLDPNIEKLYAPPSNGILTKFIRAKWLRKIAKDNPQATFVTFEYFVNMLAIIANLGMPNRLVISERNDPSRVGNGVIKGRVRELLYRKADMLVCQTDDAARYFSSHVSKQVILNPVKDDLPIPFEGTRRHTITTFCRLERQKNLGMLIGAFASFQKHHPDYTLEIYGDGAEREPLMALVESLSLSSAVTLRPARADIHDIVRDCAMFVLPSDYEGLSNSMLEAMALGLPTICTDCPCGGARSVIRPGVNGLLVPVRDEQALLDSMLRVAADEPAADVMGKEAVRIRGLLSITEIAKQWEAVVQGKVKR